MGTPASKDARLFYRCALQRFQEAKILRKADQTTGAVYLAGYGVECTLKSLILLPVAKHQTTLRSFRGGRAHDYQWLRQQYLDNGGPRFPGPIAGLHPAR